MYFCTNSDPDTRMKQHSVWWATARASKVLPGVGGEGQVAKEVGADLLIVCIPDTWDTHFFFGTHTAAHFFFLGCTHLHTKESGMQGSNSPGGHAESCRNHNGRGEKVKCFRLSTRSMEVRNSPAFRCFLQFWNS